MIREYLVTTNYSDDEKIPAGTISKSWFIAKTNILTLADLIDDVRGSLDGIYDDVLDVPERYRARDEELKHLEMGISHLDDALSRFRAIRL